MYSQWLSTLAEKKPSLITYIGGGVLSGPLAAGARLGRARLVGLVVMLVAHLDRLLIRTVVRGSRS